MTRGRKDRGDPGVSSMVDFAGSEIAISPLELSSPHPPYSCESAYKEISVVVEIDSYPFWSASGGQLCRPLSSPSLQ